MTVIEIGPPENHDWVVGSDDDPGEISRHPSRGEAETAARSYDRTEVKGPASRQSDR
jgi:hypothetical protein